MMRSIVFHCYVSLVGELYHIVNDEIRLANEETIPLIPDYVDRRSKGRSLTKDKNSSN